MRYLSSRRVDPSQRYWLAAGRGHSIEASAPGKDDGAVKAPGATKRRVTGAKVLWRRRRTKRSSSTDPLQRSRPCQLLATRRETGLLPTLVMPVL